MRLSLRQRVLLGIVAINVAVVGAQFALLARSLGKSRAEDLRDHAAALVSLVQNEIVPDGLNAGRILGWPTWRAFSDAILCDRHLAEVAPGRIMPRGVALNPLGRLRRAGDFDEQEVYRAMRAAVDSKRAVDDVEHGRVIPIDTAQGVWGACWIRVETGVDAGRLFVRYFLPIFLVSSALQSAVTFVALRRFALDPLADLARASERIARGDFSARARSRPHDDEVGRLVASFNHMTARVEGFNAELAKEVARATQEAEAAQNAAMTQRRLAAMGELAAGIAHEINNPLGGLINAADSLRQGQLDAPRREQYFGLLRSGLERIQTTVGQLLRLAPRRASSGPVSLGRCTMDALQLVRYRAQQMGVLLELAVERERGDPAAPPEALTRALDEWPPIEGDAAELAQAVLNLLVNALDALEPPRGASPQSAVRRPGKIEIVLEREPSRQRLIVRDNGPGVAPEHLDKLADLFFTTKDPGRGTGLGLALVHRAVNNAKGSVRFASLPGQGLSVTLEFQAPAPPR